ncbi:MAG: glycoside hydrolase family 127 protein [Phycisphaerales bacterium]
MIAMTCAVLAGCIAVGAAAPSRVAPVPLRQVRLADGPLHDAQERMHAYLLDEDIDRLLHNFRVQAGIPSAAVPLGGWEDPNCELRGHFTGHFLSALALMYASTHDERLRERAERLIAGLAECQAKIGSGYLSAFPESFIDRVERGERVWAPWYTLHKIAAGLLDAYEAFGDERALEMATSFAAWVGGRTDKLDDAAMQRMLDVEFGGMPEFFANLYGITKDERHLALAKRFRHAKVVDPLARGEDRLQGLHANTQVPKVLGEARRFELTGDESAERAARNFWNFVVHDRAYVTGGTSNFEYWRQPSGTLTTSLSSNDHECCVTHNLLKLTRHLHAWDGRADEMDYYERALVNGILGSIHPNDAGAAMYYVPMQSGLFRTFCDRASSYVCCSGTGIESFAKLGDSVWWQDDRGVVIELFVASEATIPERGLRIAQTTRFPDEFVTTISILACRDESFRLRMRVPAWASAYELALNGARAQGDDLAAGTARYADIERSWRAGDRVELTLTPRLSLEPLLGDPRRVAVRYGPLVLAAQLGQLDLPPDAATGLGGEAERLARDAAPCTVPAIVVEPNRPIESWLTPVEGQPLRFATRGVGRPRELRFAPFWQVFGERYAVYVDYLAPDAFDARERDRARRRGDAIDRVSVGDAQDEADHDHQAWTSERGRDGDVAWIRTSQWMRWDVDVRPATSQVLTIRCVPESEERVFEVAIEGIVVATPTLAAGASEVTVPLSPDRLGGRSRIAVMLRVAPERAPEVAVGATTAAPKPERRLTPKVTGLEVQRGA